MWASFFINGPKIVGQFQKNLELFVPHWPCFQAGSECQIKSANLQKESAKMLGGGPQNDQLGGVRLDSAFGTSAVISWL